MTLAKKNNVNKIIADFIPTKKNKPSESFLPDFGFERENNVWVYYLKNHTEKPSHLLVLNE